MPVYQRGVGIQHTDPLDCADVGNVLDPARRKGRRGPCPAGSEGRMNTGMTQFISDPTTDDGKPSEGEVDELATYYDVEPRTVQRWFDMEQGPNQQRDALNCVPVAVIGHRPCAIEDKQRERIFLAACLAVEGGFQREPLYTKGRADSGYVEPFENVNDEQSEGDGYSRHFGSLSECVQYISDIYYGNEDELSNPPISRAWVQMTIEPGEDDLWLVRVYYFMPYSGEYDNDDRDCYAD